MPTLTQQIVSYPGGSYPLVTLRFVSPDFKPDPDQPEWMQALDLAGTYTCMASLLMMDPAATLRELQQRKMAKGDPNVVVQYPN